MTGVENSRRARDAARSLLAKFAIKSVPTPLDRIAKSLGVRVQYAPLDEELSGFASMPDGGPIIGINALHAPNRQRFTLAHELAHICLHQNEIANAVHVDRGSLRRDPVSAAGLDPVEIEANAFASELLMPRQILLEILGGRSVDLEDDEAIASLAKRFRVSEAAMRFRLDLLQREPG